MGVVTLAESFITNSDMNACIHEFKKIRDDIKKNKEAKLFIQITAEKEIVDIDILLIGYFMMFKEWLPDLDIHLDLPHNRSDSSVNNLHFKLPQYANYAYLMTGKSVFHVTYSDSAPEMSPRPGGKFNDAYFILSGSFMPFCLVSKEQPELYQMLFGKNLNELFDGGICSGVAGVEWDTSNSRLHSAYSSALMNKCVPGDRIQSIANLGVIAFYTSLWKAKILHFFTDARYHEDPEYRNETLQADDLQTRTESGRKIYDAYDYFESVKGIYYELSNQPVIYQLVFGTLSASRLIPGNLQKANKQQFVKKIFSLWRFTKYFVQCLTELAKNAYEHTEKGLGVVTARIIDRERFSLLQEYAFSDYPLYKDYFETINDSFESDISALIDFRVADLGDMGIVPTLISSTHKLLEKHGSNVTFKKLLQHDIDNLKKGDIGLRNLLYRHERARLNQQSKRSIAHLGLLSFSSMVRANDGMIIASSRGEEGVCQTVFVPEIYSFHYSPIDDGTNYTVLLPVFNEKDVEPIKQGITESLLFPNESTIEELKGLEELFNYQIFRVGMDDPKELTEQPSILIYTSPDKEVDNRNDEDQIWEHLYERINPLIEKLPGGCIVNVNMEKLKLDSSELWRFLGNWTSFYQDINLLISNVPSEIYLDLVEINNIYIDENSDMDYWNASTAIFIYHYIVPEIPKDEEIKSGSPKRFYFTDALWGKTSDHFFQLNQLIHRSHFNAATLLQLPKREKENKEAKEGKEEKFNKNDWSLPIPSVNRLAFYRKNILLPFDLLLDGTENLSLFENNAVFLLNNTMQHKSTPE